VLHSEASGRPIAPSRTVLPPPGRGHPTTSTADNARHKKRTVATLLLLPVPLLGAPPPPAGGHDLPGVSPVVGISRAGRAPTCHRPTCAWASPPSAAGTHAGVGLHTARHQSPRHSLLAPLLPSATWRSWACPPPAVSHPAVVVFPTARRQPPRGRGRAPRPPSATPRSSASLPPALGRPAVVVVPPAHRRPPRGRWLPPRPLSADPRSLSRPPPTVSHPAVVGLPPGGRRPPRGLWRALHPPLATPLVLVCPLPSVGRPAVVGLPPAYDQLTYAFLRRPCASVLVETLPHVSRGAPPSLRMVSATLRLLLLWGRFSAAGYSALGPQRRPRCQVAHRPGLKVLDQFSGSCLGSRAEQGTCSHRVIFWVVFGGGSKGKGQRATALVDIIPIHRLVECGTGVRSIIAGTMPINTYWRRRR